MAGKSSGTTQKSAPRHKKKKKEKVFSAGFALVTLFMGAITFFICFSIGIILGPNLPF